MLKYKSDKISENYLQCKDNSTQDYIYERKEFKIKHAQQSIALKSIIKYQSSREHHEKLK